MAQCRESPLQESAGRNQAKPRQSSPPSAFLACEQWGRTIIYLLGIFHECYIFEDAHHVCDMTVIMVSLGGRNEKKWLASPAEKKQVNEGIAKLHNLNG